MAKAAKKKSGKGGKGGKDGNGKDVTIILKDDALPIPMDADANKNGLIGGPPDRVRWDNQSTRGRTIQFDFDWWPFEEAPTLIEVESGRRSGWYTISASTPTSGYSYGVSPPLVPGSGPDEPKVSVGD